MKESFVYKRNGKKEKLSFDKIKVRIEKLATKPYELTNIDPTQLSMEVIKGLKNEMCTSDIDVYTGEIAASLSTHHRDYLVLAARIAINNHQKNTLNGFSDKISLLYLKKDSEGNQTPLINYNYNKYVNINQDKINRYIDYTRDYNFDYFGFKTLESGYLMSISDSTIERPQDILMRTAIQIYIPADRQEFSNPIYLEKIFHAYDHMSNQYYTHATPTLFNSGGIRPNLSSCFLLGVDDSLEGLMKLMTNSAEISKWSGGIGFHLSNIRGAGANIRGTNGKTGGIIPQLRIANSIARAYDQGGKRKGSFAPYLEPHHPDIISFLNLRTPSGDENERCRDLFNALWISDLFMERVATKGIWSVFCPDKCRGLNEVWGDEYKELYIKYELAGKAFHTYEAQDIWDAIFESQKHSGLPYICYKDNVNKTNMQNNIGIIKSSNLCTEINLVSSSTETAVCNLSSICLPKFVEDHYIPEELLIDESKRRVLNHEFPIHAKMNYKLLAEIAGEITENLNMVIDNTYNPIIESARSNFKHRPIGIGIQGLADVFLKFGVAFESDKAADLNKKISEAIYYGAMSRSTEICREMYHKIRKEFDNTTGYTHTIFTKVVLKMYPALESENVIHHYSNKDDIPKTIGAYSSMLDGEGAHISRGNFHWELFGLENKDLSQLFDWETLREHVKTFGVRNSTLTAYMPTGTTSQIMGNSPCFEPYFSNGYTRTTLAGTFTVINKYLAKYLQDSNIYNTDINNYLLLNNGSIQGIEGIPDSIKALYKTVWEIGPSTIIKLAIGRQPFIDQSQSMNVFCEKFDKKIFTKIQFHGWRNGLKTGTYYTNTREASMPQKFTISNDIQESMKLSEILTSNIKNLGILPEESEETICLMCSS
jgi:ribonucleoside-diphosphate reductase alpha chain